MGERYKIAMAMQEAERERIAIEEAARLAAIEEDEKKWLAREAAIKNAEERRTSFSRFKDDVKSALLTEALTRICIGSIRNPSDNERSVCEALVGNYVQEKGAEELISEFNNKTSFLENLNQLIDKHAAIIMEEVDEKDPDTMVIDKDNMEDFFEELDDTEDMEDVTNTIRLRVANAEEDFVNKNAMDRENLKSIIQDTSKRVEDVRPGLDNDYSDDSEDDLDEGPDLPDDDTPGMGGEEDAAETESPEESSTTEPASEEEKKQLPKEDDEVVKEAKQKIYAIESRNKTVFEKMVYNLTEASIKNVEMRDQFVVENGRVDMDRIVDSVRCMYTMLEMVSTLKIENVDAQYVEETLKSIK